MIDELAVLKSVVKKLNSNKIPYMLTGSIAMGYYSIPRMTRDIDIVVEIAEIDKFYNAFRDSYYISKEMIKSSINNRGMFNIIHLAELIKVDFIIRKDTEYRKEEFSRRKRFKLNSDFIYIVSIEDLIISKLIWAKDSHSEMQLNDVKNLLKENTDLNYIKDWAAKLGVGKLLREVINE